MVGMFRWLQRSVCRSVVLPTLIVVFTANMSSEPDPASGSTLEKLSLSVCGAPVEFALVPMPALVRVGKIKPDVYTLGYEKVERQVYLTAMRWAGVTEVTNAQFACFLNEESIENRQTMSLALSSTEPLLPLLS